jgi:hypothetical protein
VHLARLADAVAAVLCTQTADAADNVGLVSNRYAECPG